MTNREVMLLLLRIDYGYEPTDKEREELSSVKALTWNSSESSYRGNILYSSQDQNHFLIRENDGSNHIPYCISMLKSLQHLDLSNSSIDKLPYTIGKLKNIRRLNLENNPLNSLPEEIGNLTLLERLSIRNTNLRELPVCIGKLRNIQTLNLSDTQIECVPDVVMNMKNLEHLLLGRTYIEELPGFIGDLTKLQKLSLRGTQIHTLPDTIGNLINLRELCLWGTMIDELPECISNLSKLEKLDLRKTQIRELPTWIEKLSSLRTLNLWNTQIRELPACFGKLPELQSLSLDKTQITELPECIGELQKLQVLRLNNTQIKQLPEFIGNMTSLQSLNLRGTKVTEIPRNIGNLYNLHSLNVSVTMISELPDTIERLSNLHNLNLRETHLNKIPVSIRNMTHLRWLGLGGVGIRELPSWMKELQSIRFLFIWGTKIKELPEWIGDLGRLQMLDISDTQIRELPKTIGKLTRLNYFDLSGTKILKLPDTIENLSNLKWLIIEDLTLSELPESIMELKLEFQSQKHIRDDITGIFINGLKLQKQPVSLFFQPRELIVDYYRQRHIEVNETKVIFLGSEGVGKTHTILRILNDNHILDEKDEPSEETPGISITSKAFITGHISYRINFWDFGGQELMHAMHRCFLTDRTGYVVVVSTRLGDLNKQARDWMRNIESFTNDAPVVVFVNIWSDGTSYDIDEYSLRKDYPNIISVIRCSAKNGSDAEFSVVVKAIQKMALCNESISMSFPESWENIRQEIIHLGRTGSKKYYISQQEFIEKCNENGIFNGEIQQWLLGWFNDLGECFSYQFEKTRLNIAQNLKVLNPEWLTNAIYIIVREARDLAVDGSVSHEGIRNKLDHSEKGTMKNVSYSEDECNYVLEVMRKFKLSYNVPNKEYEFIPGLLRDKKPADLDRNIDVPEISYEMHYKYLPDNVIHNFMVAMYPYLDLQHCWRKGAVIDVRNVLKIGLYAILDMSRADNILRIKVYSYNNHAPWELLQEIRSCLLDINDTMNLIADDVIIIEEGVSVEKVRVESLLKRKQRGETHYQGDENNYLINDLLGVTFGDKQVQRMESTKYNEEDSDGNADFWKKNHNAYVLSIMREALKQPLNERVLHLNNAAAVTCATICEYIIAACAQIQGNSGYWNPKEDIRSIQIKDVLKNRGLNVEDHSWYGNAMNSTNPGEVDLIVLDNGNNPLTIIEAMNLDSVNTDYIFTHLKKLLDNYNPNGLPELFLIAYVKKAKHRFQSFWEKYCEYIKRTDVDRFKFRNMEECYTGKHFIKHASVIYDCNGAHFKIHHICMRSGD